MRTEVCTERHQRNREELKTLETRVNNHGKELDALSVDFAEHVATQAEINRQTLEQLKELQKRTAAIEDQPKRWEQVLGIIVNWATSGGHPRDQDDCPNSGGDDRHERGYLEVTG